jgi:cytochrome P450
MRFSTWVAQTYGGIARVPLGRKSVFLVSEPKLLRELLIFNRDKYMKNVRYGHFQKLVGLGMLLSEGDSWKAQRLTAQPAFKPKHVYAQVPWMSSITSRFLDGWESRAGTGAAFDVDPHFFHLSRLLAGEMILGPGFDEIAEDFCRHANDIKNGWPRAPRSVLGMLRPPSRRLKARFDTAVDGLDALTYAFLERHRQDNFEDAGIVGMLARSSAEQGEPYTDVQLRDQIMTLFFAGHETSATALTWIHYLLSTHPEVREKVEREVAAVVGGDRPTAKEVGSLTYTEQVVNESLRLYSPIHAISRVATEDNSIGGYLIPKGSTVVVSLFATHRLPQYWPDPERFDPERFTPEESAKRPDFSFIPFAAGHRNCIGGSMAMIELKMIVAMLAQRYRLTLVPDHPIELEPGTTMYPLHGMQMTLERRRRAA